jgi:23S rRNA (cytidine1920-2'-O)/16S rRNA (cytidine1409-2'-O)-methyltransferase
MRRVPLLQKLKTLHPEREEKELFSLILRGGVIVNGDKVLKPGTRIDPGASVRVRDLPRFVSRGGEKLAAALDAWEISCKGATWIDAGCSSGGFTDCLLQRGASLVYAVDVGVGQLDWRLRGDPRVRVMEGTNIMTVSRARLDPVPQRAVADLSFRSLQGAARHILGLVAEKWGIFLAKPQFELREPMPDFRGVVESGAALRGILSTLLANLASEGVRTLRACRSPLVGRKGNREFLLMLSVEKGGGDIEELLAGLSLE